MSRGRIKLFANRSGMHFAEKLSRELNINLSQMGTLDFANGESKILLKDSARGCDVYIIQSCFDPTSSRNIYQNFFELLQAGDAMRRSGANKITAVLPEIPFSRQDKSTGREPLTARLAADMIEASGFDNVITSDLHAKQIVGFYEKAKIDNLPASHVLASMFRELYPEVNGDLVCISPDVGGAARAEYYARRLECRAAQAFKMRSTKIANEVETLKVAGLVRGHNILIVDDMVDTAGSIVKLHEKLTEKDVTKVMICCTHALLNGPAIERLNSIGCDLITTDTIPRDENFKKENPWYKEISLAPLFAKAIYNINHDQSVSDLYEDE